MKRASIFSIIFLVHFVVCGQVKEIQVDTTTLKNYVGEYELTPALHIVITLENGLLQAQATGQEKNPLYAEKKNYFFLKVVDAQLEFFSDANGKTDHLILYQNGQKVTGKKLGADGSLPAPPIRKEIVVDINTLKKYVGEYELIPAFHIVITLENGALQAQATGQPKFPLYAEKKNFFFYKVVDAQIEFVPDGSGKTDHLILYQNGMEQKGQKIQ